MAAAQGACQSPSVWPLPIVPNAAPHKAAPIPANVASAGAAPTAQEPIHVIHLAFEVLRAEMPMAGAMNSRKVWNHVDGIRIGAGVAATLACNGLRVGVGTTASWPAIAAILEAAGAKTGRDQLLAQAGAPLMIELGQVTDSETVFSYGADRRLSGTTLEGGSKVIRLDYAYHPHLDGATELVTAFEIRRDRGELTWERQPDGSVRQIPAVDRHAFEDLRARVTVNAGEFLVIGPSEQAENEYIVGSRFLTRHDGGQRYETLLIITPQPFQSASVRQRR